MQLYGFASVIVGVKYPCFQGAYEKERQPAVAAHRANGYQNGRFQKSTVVHERHHMGVKNGFTGCGAV